MRERERERERQRHRQREKKAPRREPDMGLNPRTTGSHPEPRAQPLNHPGVPYFHFINKDPGVARDYMTCHRQLFQFKLI